MIQMKHLIVTAAVLIEGGEILCMQRGESKFDYISYKYEFPGEKLKMEKPLKKD